MVVSDIQNKIDVATSDITQDEFAAKNRGKKQEPVGQKKYNYEYRKRTLTLGF